MIIFAEEPAYKHLDGRSPACSDLPTPLAMTYADGKATLRRQLAGGAGDGCAVPGVADGCSDGQPRVEIESDAAQVAEVRRAVWSHVVAIGTDEAHFPGWRGGGMERMFAGKIAVVLWGLEGGAEGVAGDAVAARVDLARAPGRGPHSAMASDIAAGIVAIDCRRP